MRFISSCDSELEQLQLILFSLLSLSRNIFILEMYFTHFLSFLKIQLKFCSCNKSIFLRYNDRSHKLEILNSTIGLIIHGVNFCVNISYTSLMTIYALTTQWNDFPVEDKVLGSFLLLCILFGNVCRITFLLSREEFICYINSTIYFEREYLLNGTFKTKC